MNLTLRLQCYPCPSRCSTLSSPPRSSLSEQRLISAFHRRGVSSDGPPKWRIRGRYWMQVAILCGAGRLHYDHQRLSLVGVAVNGLNSEDNDSVNRAGLFSPGLQWAFNKSGALHLVLNIAPNRKRSELKSRTLEGTDTKVTFSCTVQCLFACAHRHRIGFWNGVIQPVPVCGKPSTHPAAHDRLGKYVALRRTQRSIVRP
jgi:hypothetical protein